MASTARKGRDRINRHIVTSDAHGFCSGFLLANTGVAVPMIWNWFPLYFNFVIRHFICTCRIVRVRVLQLWSYLCSSWYSIISFESRFNFAFTKRTHGRSRDGVSKTSHEEMGHVAFETINVKIQNLYVLKRIQHEAGSPAMISPSNGIPLIYSHKSVHKISQNSTIYR